MAYGLQLWDNSGNLSLDTSSRILKEYGEFTGRVDGVPYGGTGTTSIYIPGMADNGTWAAFVQVTGGNQGTLRPYITFTPNYLVISAWGFATYYIDISITVFRY